jgi:hypothetical protein
MLAGNPRTSLMTKNITKMPAEDRTAIRENATMTLIRLNTL